MPHGPWLESFFTTASSTAVRWWGDTLIKWILFGLTDWMTSATGPDQEALLSHDISSACVIGGHNRHHLFSDWPDRCKTVVFVYCILDVFPYSALESKSLTQVRLQETEICLLDISQSAVSQRQQVCMSTTTTIKFCYLDACLFHQY